ncbi:hypothetical protein H8356DRAFT_962335 [Neocallimastix lanati (nom. inval.)]|nr:hypothetical protein H8356DRAFT_962335 [Neocallimastix sp. JGI-2020a]
MEYRYGNNLNQQFSFQNYLISQSYNDLLLQQQQQIQQLTTSDMSLQLFQLQNNIINYNSNPSLLFHSIKEPFYANQHYSQIQESAYSPITLSSQAQRPILTSSHQFTNQYSQQVQNLYNNNTFNDIPNINDNVNNNVNNNNKKVTTDNMENIHIISINEKINENLSKSNNKITKKKNKETNNSNNINITMISSINNTKSDENVNPKSNENRNSIKENKEKEVRNNFSKSIQLQSPRSQSPIPKVEICKHIPVQLQSPQSQSQTPQQMKSPTFIMPSKKDTILTSPVEPKILTSQSSVNDLKFLKINEKLKKTIEIKKNEINTSSKIFKNKNNQNVENENIPEASNNKILEILETNKRKENANETDNINLIKSLNEHPLEIPILNKKDTDYPITEEDESLKIISNINNKEKVEINNINITQNKNIIKIINKNEIVDEISKEHLSNKMDIDPLNIGNTIVVNKNIEKLQEVNQVKLNVEINNSVDKSKKSINVNGLTIENNLNLVQSQPNDSTILISKKVNFPIPNLYKHAHNYHSYPPRVSVLNQKFQRYLQQRQYMKSRSYERMTMNFSPQRNSLYYPPKSYNYSYNYYALQNNKTLSPHSIYSKMYNKLMNSNYLYYNSHPSYHPYSYPFMNIYNSNYNNRMIYKDRRFEFNNNFPNPNTLNYNNINSAPSYLNLTPYATPTPIKIPPLSAFFKKDSFISQYLNRTLSSPINKKKSRLKIKSTIDKSIKTSCLGKKCYLNMPELDSVIHGDFSLRYLNFFLLKNKNENDNHNFEEFINLAELTIPNNIKKIVDITSISENKIPRYQDIFDKYIQSTSFIALKINFSIPKTFKEKIFLSTLIFETNVFRRVKCTTTVYSFGKKILETDEICNTSLKNGRYILNFEFVNKFFTDFLTKFDDFKTYEEKQFAFDNLAIIQQFNDITIFNEEPRKWLVIGYQFDIGNGKIDIAKVKDLGFSD